MTAITPGHITRGRAPLRLGLGGGGSDVDPYCSQFGGLILNATIDKYAYAYVEASKAPGTVEFHSPDRRCTGRAAMYDVESLVGDFGLHVGVYRRMIDLYHDGKPISLRMTTQVDAPPGSGLGSSSTIVVAMVTAMAEHLRVELSQYEIARLAWEIERIDLGLAGGWQDQYAAAFGGFNFMECAPGSQVLVNPLRMRREVTAELEASLLLYFGGVSRDSAAVIERQAESVRGHDTRAIEATHAVKAEASAMKQHLLVGNVPAFARSLKDGWEAKKQLALGISNPAIDHAYNVATDAGMVAGKISGAGGGGFMMMIVDPARRLDVTRAVESQCGGQVMTCHFTDTGGEAWSSKPHTRSLRVAV